MVAPGGDLVGRAAAQDVGDVRDPESLSHSRNTRQDLAGHDNGIRRGFELLQAVIAGAAVVALILLAKVCEQQTMATGNAGGIALDVAKQLARCVSQLAVALEHQPPLHEVGCRVNQEALGLQPVASRPPRLLLIMLERLWRSGMNHEPDIGSIDSPAEGE